MSCWKFGPDITFDPESSDLFKGFCTSHTAQEVSEGVQTSLNDGPWFRNRNELSWKYQTDLSGRERESKLTLLKGRISKKVDTSIHNRYDVDNPGGRITCIVSTDAVTPGQH